MIDTNVCCDGGCVRLLTPEAVRLSKHPHPRLLNAARSAPVGRGPGARDGRDVAWPNRGAVRL